MTYTVPTQEPDVVTAGETWHWTRQFGDFPTSEGWTLTYYFRGLGTIDVVATVINGQFDVLATAANTAALAAGRYAWDAKVSLSGEIHTAASGVLTVKPNLQTAAAGSQQTHNEQMLALIETELQHRLTGVATGGSGAIEAYAIHGRQISKIKTSELKTLRGQYLAAVRRERTPGKISTPVEVHYGPTS